MTEKVSRNHLLRITFILIAVALLATATLAQTRTSLSHSTHKAVPTAQGNPLFVPPVTYPSGGWAASVAVADLNADGKPDLAVSNEGLGDNDGSVAVLLGNGDGTFQPAVTYSALGSTPVSIAVADLNGDGKPDLAVAGFPPAGYSSSLSVFIGNGDGTFQPAVSYDADGASAIAIADVDGDGFPDLLVAISHAYGSAGVLLGNGDGTFQPVTTYDSAGTSPSALTIGDLNGDGKPDLVLGNFYPLRGNSTTVAVLLGNGDGTFQPAVTYYSGGNQLFAVASGDLNGDGNLDVVTANCVPGGTIACSWKHAKNGTVGVLLGNGDGTLQAAAIYDSGGQYANGVAIADIDGDSKLDIAVTTQNSIGILLGNGDGTFQQVITYTTPGLSPFRPAAADVNGDGRPDLIVNAGGGGIGVLLNNTGPHTSTTTALTSSQNPVNAGASVTYTAAVTGAPGSTVTGTVTFQDGATVLATVGLSNNQATYTRSYKARQNGFHSITASYSGDLYNSVSTSAPLAEDVLAPSRTAVATSQSPSPAGQPVTFTAAITSAYGSTSDGETVSFYADGILIGTGLTTGGKSTFTTSSLTVGKHTINATYPGDTILEPSSGKVKQVISK